MHYEGDESVECLQCNYDLDYDLYCKECDKTFTWEQITERDERELKAYEEFSRVTFTDSYYEEVNREIEAMKEESK
ncbi:hypothetical protein [Listeria phage List-36]|uniref:Uncharacterized protein n=6 Tax=Pecentumvirus TaxID=1857844 RepID=A0A5C2IBN8_9CAUD|nr:hypothetical protein AG2_030 [Listeria phage vB_LmoM_AG20]YP_009042846.1 hypothetical protein LP048_038 [Listeria phage LP-048]YP_009043511.1 hypothetical protein HH35_gp148 [Listeria phage List-36]YP_009055632.1 hypothetical protein LD12_gp044 [Listeria phage LMTA-148]QEP53034.2 hypothetical protein FK485_0034 [Listeria phage LP-039]QIG60786.1 putative DNA binding protein [Listeria phage vB_Lino_VEfB7]QNL31801.1 hypothetical protein HUK29_0034 [Listeria phage LP-Mix_6.1]WIW77260.1 hypoth